MSKTFYIADVAAAIVCFIMLFFAAPIMEYATAFYNRNAIVTEVSGDVITCRDDCGYTWEFTGDNFCIGDKIKMRMFNNYTDFDIEDDEVRNVERR